MENEYINADGRAFDGRVWPLWVASIFSAGVCGVIVVNLTVEYVWPIIARLV